jgi:hypothetical protein
LWHPVVYFIAFPLILIPHAGEKEQQLIISIFAKTVRAVDRLQFAKTLGAFLPLPEGEGRGENSPKHSRFEPLNHPAHSNVKTLRAFLLLPGGEGRDEGERHTIIGFMGRGKTTQF